MTVVVMATTTRALNIACVTMPAARPRLRATSCISPRAFISAPTRRATGPGSPATRAASQQAPNLPTTATTTHPPVKSRTGPEPSRAKSVFSPE